MIWLRELLYSWFSKETELKELAPEPAFLFKKPQRKVTRVFLHCSASDNPAHDNIATIKRWHTDPKPNGRGWTDVGYHYFINKGGGIEHGRPLSRIPAAQARHNTGTIAICLSGLEQFTEAQFISLRNLCRAILKDLPDVTFHGHCEVSAKACPVFDYKKVLNLNSRGRIKPNP